MKVLLFVPVLVFFTSRAHGDEPRFYRAYNYNGTDTTSGGNRFLSPASPSTNNSGTSRPQSSKTGEMDYIIAGVKVKALWREDRFGEKRIENIQNPVRGCLENEVGYASPYLAIREVTFAALASHHVLLNDLERALEAGEYAVVREALQRICFYRKINQKLFGETGAREYSELILAESELTSTRRTEPVPPKKFISSFEKLIDKVSDLRDVTQPLDAEARISALKKYQEVLLSLRNQFLESGSSANHVSRLDELKILVRTVSFDSPEIVAKYRDVEAAASEVASKASASVRERRAAEDKFLSALQTIERALPTK